MKAATLSEIKNQLTELTPAKTTQLCLRMARYRKENKELLTYLLFESQDEETYIRNIKNDIDSSYEEMNRSNLYLVKKSLRKILRTANKFVKYSGNKQTEVEVLIYYCQKLNASGIKFSDSPVLVNLYERQLQRIKKALSMLHEDLQYDYSNELEKLI